MKSTYWLHIQQTHWLHIHQIHTCMWIPGCEVTACSHFVNITYPGMSRKLFILSILCASVTFTFRNCDDVIPCRSYSFVIVFVPCIVSLWDLRSCDCMHILESGVILRYFVGELSHFLVKVLFWESKRDISHFENPYIAPRKRIASDILICHVKPYDAILRYIILDNQRRKSNQKKKNR